MSSSHNAQTTGTLRLPGKTFIPLENNPEVFTNLVHSMGLSPSFSFYDVLSLTDPDLLAFIPRPVLALIFIAPMSAVVNRPQEDADAPEDYPLYGPDEPVIYFRQTIGNACGMMALIHSTANGATREHVSKGSLLDDLLTKAVNLPMKERSELLYNSEELENAHMHAAIQGDSMVPPAEEHPNHAFICFVKSNGKLWELDGGTRKGPLCRGELSEDEDMLSEKALSLGVKKHFEWSPETQFSLIALAPTLT